MLIFSSSPEGIDCCNTVWTIDDHITATGTAAAATAAAAAARTCLLFLASNAGIMLYNWY